MGLNTPAHTYRRGAAVDIVEAITGIVIDPLIHTARARIKPVDPHDQLAIPGDDVAEAGPGFTSTVAAASGDDPAMMSHAMTAAETIDVPAGLYVFDSSLIENGQVIFTTDPQVLEFTNSVSAPEPS